MHKTKCAQTNLLFLGEQPLLYVLRREIIILAKVLLENWARSIRSRKYGMETKALH